MTQPEEPDTTRLDLSPRPRDETEEAKQDSLIPDYRTILAELALLTTVSTLLFGFLLASVRSVGGSAEEWIQGLAMVLVASATMVFLLPAAYHHLQFPYRDFEKFQERTMSIDGLPTRPTDRYIGGDA